MFKSVIIVNKTDQISEDGVGNAGYQAFKIDSSQKKEIIVYGEDSYCYQSNSPIIRLPSFRVEEVVSEYCRILETRMT